MIETDFVTNTRPEPVVKSNEWTTEWPTEPGYYWFYGYRYGKQSNTNPLGDTEPELVLVEVFEIANGMESLVVTVGNGEFVSKREPSHAHWLPATLPALPDLGD